MKDPRTRLLALALQRASFLSTEERLKLWDLVDDLAGLSVLSLRDLEQLIGRRLNGRRWNALELVVRAEEDAVLLERIGARFIHHDDPEYPPLLRETARPPFGLYLRGAMLSPDVPAVAIVGTRLPTGKGLETAHGLARDLAASGLPIVSGLARGIDAAAHRGALAAAGGSSGVAPGITCAVLPCGVERVYPQSNRGLAAAILDAGGLLLSENPPGTELHKFRFPERNRIIAGVARGTVVVEAPAGSGALITAGEALGEGRDLWVAGACLGGARSAGIDRLAAEGAPLLHRAEELLADWGVEAAPLAHRKAGGRAEPSGSAAVGSVGEGRRLAASLGAELELGSETRERALSG